MKYLYASYMGKTQEADAGFMLQVISSGLSNSEAYTVYSETQICRWKGEWLSQHPQTPVNYK